MQSDLLKLGSDLSGIRDVLDKLELLARADGFTDTRSIRLLAEEMILAVSRILPGSDSAVWIDTEDDDFRIHVLAKALIDDTERDKLIAVSTSGKNTVPKGFFAKIAYYLDELYDPTADGMAYFNDMAGDTFTPLHASMQYSPAYHSYSWSYEDYKSKAEDDELEGIEKTLIESCADDVIVTARRNAVEIMAVKRKKLD